MHKFRDVIPQFDVFLASSGLRLEATVIGGAALQLLGVITRTTKDCDVLDPKLSVEVLNAAKEFAIAHRLAPDWLNNGPITLASELPLGWSDRRVEAFRGKALVLFALGREDTLRSKLYAYLDRGIDLDDLKALRPSEDEIVRLSPWLIERDGNPDWPTHVKRSMSELIGILDEANE